jgi:hypothetical protein
VKIDIHSLYIDYVQLEVPFLSLDTKVTPDDPFIGIRRGSSLISIVSGFVLVLRGMRVY